MDGYILDTSVVSVQLDHSHQRHSEIDAALAEMENDSVLFLSVVTLAELAFGVSMAKAFGHVNLPGMEQMLTVARRSEALPVTHHTSTAYAELKTKLAKQYLAKASRRDRPRWVEEWVDRTSGQKLQIDENDLWICSQAKERDLTVVTSDRRMRWIRDADSDVRLRIL